MVDTRLMQDLSDAFDSIGAPIYSDQFLARLMAWAALSEFCEATTTNLAMNAVLQIAARRFKVQGGERPDLRKLKLWVEAMAELAKKGAKTEWLEPLMKRYHIDDGWKKIPYKANFRATYAGSALFRG